MDSEAAGLGLLLRVEGMARQAANLAELGHLMANETRKLNRARQIFVISLDDSGAPRVAAASGVSVIDPRAAMVEAVVGLLKTVARERGLQTSVDFTLPAYCDADSDLAKAYPFREMAWQPLLDRKKRVFAGLLMARENVWSEDDLSISNRMAETFAHAWRELATAPLFRPQRRIRGLWQAGVVAALILMIIPWPMSALAPAEIVAREPMIVAAPLDGAIERVAVDPGWPVKKGDVLVAMSDTALRNRLEVARQDVIVAEARAKRATMLAFIDSKGRHELGIAQAELDL